MIFCKGLGSSCLKLVMNMSRTSKRSDSPAFPFQRPSHNFPLYLSLLWLLGFACQHSQHQQPTLQCQARSRRALLLCPSKRPMLFYSAPSRLYLGPRKSRAR